MWTRLHSCRIDVLPYRPRLVGAKIVFDKMLRASCHVVKVYLESVPVVILPGNPYSNSAFLPVTWRCQKRSGRPNRVSGLHGRSQYLFMRQYPNSNLCLGDGPRERNNYTSSGTQERDRSQLAGLSSPNRAPCVGQCYADSSERRSWWVVQVAIRSDWL